MYSRTSELTLKRPNDCKKAIKVHRFDCFFISKGRITMIEGMTQIPEGISQTEQEFVQIGTRGIATKSSWFYHLQYNLPLVFLGQDRKWHYIPRTYTLLNQKKTEEEELEPISLDQGNGIIKLAGQSRDHRLKSIAIPSRIEVVEDQVIHGTKGRSVWRVGTPTALEPMRLRIGNDATGRKARGFAVGKTSERFEDPMYAQLLKVAIVQLLKSLGHAPGEHTLAIGLAIRIPEITVDEVGKQTVDPNVTKAIRQHIKGTFTVEETVGKKPTIWTIHVQRVFPTIQTVGSFFLWGFNLLCEPAQNKFRGVRVLDLGTGDLGEAIARQKPNQPLVIEGHVISEGAIGFASAVSEAMKANFSSTHTTIAKAQQAVIENEVEIGGQAYPLILPEDLHVEDAENISSSSEEDENESEIHPSPLLHRLLEQRAHDAAYDPNVVLKINAVRRSYRDAVEQLLLDSNPALQDQSLFLIVTGGALKNPLFANKLERRIRTLNRTYSDSLTMPVENDFSVVANALGTYVFTCWQINRLLAEQSM